MSYVDWMIQTRQIGTCSCDYGCPCEFNAPPTRLPCEGVLGVEIVGGHFGAVRLDGLRVAGVYRWPGPVHEGGGTWWSVIDRRANGDQVHAIATIFGGQEQAPNTGFAIYASTIAHEPDPVFADIDFEFDLDLDLDGRRGRIAVRDVLRADITPIKNPVTGADHWAAIRLPYGFEFREAEMASADIWSAGELNQRHVGRYAAMSLVTYDPNGIVVQQSLPAIGR